MWLGAAIRRMGDCPHQNIKPYLERGWPWPCGLFRGDWICHHLRRCEDCKRKLGRLDWRECPTRLDSEAETADRDSETGPLEG
jgi:hypothetical protein